MSIDKSVIEKLGQTREGVTQTIPRKEKSVEAAGRPSSLPLGQGDPYCSGKKKILQFEFWEFSK